jgi:hypothetical protein
MGMAETRDAVDLVVVDLPRACRRDWMLAPLFDPGFSYAYIRLLDSQHYPLVHAHRPTFLLMLDLEPTPKLAKSIVNCQLSIRSTIVQCWYSHR